MAEAPRRIWVTRARPGADRTADRLTALGFQPLVAPLLEVRALDVAAPDLDGIAALAFTSANAVAAFAALTPRRDRPVFAVGDATAEAARAAGFAIVTSAGGDVVDLGRLLEARAPGPVLHPRARVPAADLAPLSGSVPVSALDVYETVETGAPAPEAFDAVLLHSPRAASALAAALAPEAARDRLAVALSPAVAAPLSTLPFAGVRVAAMPNEAALLEALGKARPGL